MQKNVIACLLALFLASSCATVFLGTTQRVRINSDPPGARVYVHGEDMNKTTPCEINISRKQPRNVRGKREVIYELKMKDYNYVEIRDESHKNYLLTYLSWYPLLIPGVVDLSTGANNIYQGEQFARLHPAGEVVFKTDTIVRQEIVYVETGSNQYVFQKSSDVDADIPFQVPQKPRGFALVIGNEDYSSRQIGLSPEINVNFARNDASAFKEYAVKMLGVPERNVIFLLDATSGQMKQAINRINALIRASNGEAEVYVYYAGHGLPDEKTREAFLMPVDVSGSNAFDGIKLTELYHKLSEHPSRRVTVFIDACFSGGAREQGLLAARGVRVRPKEDSPEGNLVVFTASSGDESALPYIEQHHGLFTYFLLKAFREFGPDVSYRQVADYLKINIELESILINEREQTPQVNVSPSIFKDWEGWRFN